MPSKKTRTRASRRAPKKPTVAELLSARIEREQRLAAKKPAPPLNPNEKLHSLPVASERTGYAVWTLRHMAASGRLNYFRRGRRLFISESEIARLAGTFVAAVNAA